MRALFVVVVVLVLGWFALGTHLNIRKGNRVLRWLQDGLILVGEKTTLRWLGSSAVELRVQNAREPFRSVEVFVVLEPRDVPFLLWFYRARGRSDLLIVRSHLRAMPHLELEALDPHAWSTRGLERAAQQKKWSPIGSSQGSPLVVYAHGKLEKAWELVNFAVLPELSLVRLAARHDVPNLEAQWKLSGFERLDSRRVFEALRRVAERL